LSDDLVELQFQIRDFFGTLGVPVSMDGRVTFERIVPVDDVDVLAYGVATGDGIDALEALVAGNPTWKAISVIQREGDSTHFVARVADPPTVSQTIANGGYLVQSVIEDGDSYVTVHLPASVDVREVVESVRASFPNLVMVSRRQVKRSRTPLARVQPVLREALTERQRTALEAAFDAGYFDRPRRSSGVEVADSLGITASTFHQHLRAAENKLVDWVLSPPAERPSDPATG